VDWDDEQARNVFLQRIVADAQRLMLWRKKCGRAWPNRPPERQQIADAAAIVGTVDRPGCGLDGGGKLKEGVSRDRIVSVHDPEMRHGRKSSAKRFDGHKAAIAVDAESH